MTNIISDSRARRIYREHVYDMLVANSGENSYLRDKTILLTTSADGNEIINALNRGFVDKNITVICENPGAIDSDLYKRYPRLNIIIAPLVVAFGDFKLNTKFDYVILDIEGSISWKTVKQLKHFQMWNHVFSSKTRICITTTNAGAQYESCASKAKSEFRDANEQYVFDPLKFMFNCLLGVGNHKQIGTGSYYPTKGSKIMYGVHEYNRKFVSNIPATVDVEVINYWKELNKLQYEALTVLLESEFTQVNLASLNFEDVTGTLLDAKQINTPFSGVLSILDTEVAVLRPFIECRERLADFVPDMHEGSPLFVTRSCNRFNQAALSAYIKRRQK